MHEAGVSQRPTGGVIFGRLDTDPIISSFRNSPGPILSLAIKINRLVGTKVRYLASGVEEYQGTCGVENGCCCRWSAVRDGRQGRHWPEGWGWVKPIFNHNGSP